MLAYFRPCLKALKSFHRWIKQSEIRVDRIRLVVYCSERNFVQQTVDVIVQWQVLSRLTWSGLRLSKDSVNATNIKPFSDRIRSESTVVCHNHASPCQRSNDVDRVHHVTSTATSAAASFNYHTNKVLLLQWISAVNAIHMSKEQNQRLPSIQLQRHRSADNPTYWDAYYSHAYLNSSK